MKQTPVSKLKVGKQYWMMGGKVTIVKNCFSLVKMIEVENKRRKNDIKIYTKKSFVREDSSIGFFYEDETFIEVE
jgi:hypothetical protein